MLIQEWQTCEACGGTGCGTEFCPHCGNPHPSFKPCIACQGKGGWMVLVMRPDLTPIVRPSDGSYAWPPAQAIYYPPPWPPPGSAGRLG